MLKQTVSDVRNVVLDPERKDFLVMIIRIWRTEIQTAHMAEYEKFAQERSLPMFRKQQGFLGDSS